MIFFLVIGIAFQLFSIFEVFSGVEVSKNIVWKNIIGAPVKHKRKTKKQKNKKQKKSRKETVKMY